MSMGNGGDPGSQAPGSQGTCVPDCVILPAANQKRMLDVSANISLRKQCRTLKGGRASEWAELLIAHVFNRCVRMFFDLSRCKRVLRTVLVHALTSGVRGGHVPYLDRGGRQEKRCVARPILGSVGRRGVGSPRRRFGLDRKNHDNGPRSGLLTLVHGSRPSRINLGVLSAWASRRAEIPPTHGQIRRRTWTAPTAMVAA